MLIAGVDTTDFTPKMVQVAVQSALANADPPGLCPMEAGIRKYDPRVSELVQAMCASLGGEPESASAQIDHVVTVRPGDTAQSLASRMAYRDYKLERFLSLNGLPANGALAPGQKVKLVVFGTRR